jgi:putative membrane protein
MSGLASHIAARKLPLSVFLIWLLHLSGLLGILSGQGDWFIPKTPLNLMLMGLLFVWNFPLDTGRKVVLFAFIWMAGIGAEWVGVHTGYLFGRYAYGENLGPKIDGIPYLIGVNWALLSFCAGCVSRNLPGPVGLRILAGALLLVGLDFFMEGMAPALDFWTFEGGSPHLWNYICWFLLSAGFLLGYERLGIRGDKVFSAHLLGAQFAFFITLYFLY